MESVPSQNPVGRFTPNAASKRLESLLRIPQHSGTSSTTLNLTKLKAAASQALGAGTREVARLLLAGAIFAGHGLRNVAALVLALPLFVVWVAMLDAMAVLRVVRIILSPLLPEPAIKIYSWLLMAPLNTIAYICERTFSFAYDLLPPEDPLEGPFQEAPQLIRLSFLLGPHNLSSDQSKSKWKTEIDSKFQNVKNEYIVESVKTFMDTLFPDNPNRIHS